LAELKNLARAEALAVPETVVGSSYADATNSLDLCKTRIGHETRVVGSVMRSAAVVIGLLAACLAAWLVLLPLFSGSYSAAMTNSTTGQMVSCRATATPAWKAERIVSLCVLACEERGFHLLPGQTVMDMEFASSGAERRAALPFAHLFPASCSI
jgi:hypothetical protein